MSPQTELVCLACGKSLGSADKCPLCGMRTLDLSSLPKDTEVPPDSSFVGKEFGGYQIRGVAARDAISVSCQALHVATNRQTLLRVIPLSRGLVPHLRRTIDACQKLSALHHPILGEVFGVDLRSSVLYIAGQAYSSSTLRDRLRQGPIPAKQAAGVLKQLGDGLRTAHSENIVHGDLHPGNVFIDDKDQCKIVNFGLPTDLVDPGSIRKVSYPHLFWCPERWKGAKLDARSDLYQLGGILYNMLAGRPPFDSLEPAKLMTHHAKTVPQAPSDLRQDVPRELGAIALKLLEKIPEKRYASSSDLLNDLDSYEAELPVRAYEERRNVVVCPHCWTENPAKATDCKKCRQPIHGKKRDLKVGTHETEFLCDICEHPVERGASACWSCMNPVCYRCGAGTSTSRKRMCPRCEALVPSRGGMLARFLRAVEGLFKKKS